MKTTTMGTHASRNLNQTLTGVRSLAVGWRPNGTKPPFTSLDRYTGSGVFGRHAEKATHTTYARSSFHFPSRPDEVDEPIKELSQLFLCGLVYHPALIVENAPGPRDQEAPSEPRLRSESP
jgi:hypothetical protein